ncbi:Protein kinase [Melia azedarach]|uniref:Protein kinase n=1 Tax=Melia azedarach TaxID=155640 RepID=A0ACC1WWU6_MELAZ|nr:Protein kinase [Melia azedarach]
MPFVGLFGSRTLPIISLLHLLSFLLQSSSDAQIQPTYIYHYCLRLSNNTASDDYVLNLGKLNEKLRGEGSTSSYYNATAGDYPDKVYGLYLCRIGTSYQVCQDCIEFAIDRLIRNCTGTREAIVWYEECLVRFSDRSFASTMETFPYQYMCNNVTETDKFSKILSLSFDDVIRNAASNHSKYASQTAIVSSFQKLDTLAQCLPDLSISDCTVCLKEAVAYISSCCSGRVFFPSCNIRFEVYPCFNGSTGPAKLATGFSTSQGVVHYVSISPTAYRLKPVSNNLSVGQLIVPTGAPTSQRGVPYITAGPAAMPISPRSDNNIDGASVPAFPPRNNNIDGPSVPVFPPSNNNIDGPSVPVFPPSNNNIDPGKKTKKDGRTWIAITSSVSAILLVLIASSFLWLRKRRNKRAKEEKASTRKFQLPRIANDVSYNILRGEKQTESQEFPLFPLKFILRATQYFSDENKLGEGGFGPVYKGTLADGKEIAVKRLSRTSGQGLQEFKTEVTVIAKLQHKNLVRLLGCCLEENESLLIYEYMPNKSLDVFLFDSTRRLQLDWKRRVSIINGIARGILYLHEDSRLKIIHRDLKASNVLLDHEMNPKISDFGMARIFGGNQSEANTNRVVGTYGYMAPEYAMEGSFSIKSDVFSFGVLLLEIITGSKNGGFYLLEHGQSLLTYTWNLWCKGEALDLMDPVIKQTCVSTDFLKCIQIGLLCVQEDPADRPVMSSVVFMLASETMALPQPTQPAFSVGRVMARPVQSPSDNQVCSVNEVTLSTVSPR